jgi:hypothetical protein
MLNALSFIARLGLACAGIGAGSGDQRRQRGAAVLAFALVGLTGTTVLAMPVLARAANDLHVESTTAVRSSNAAVSAAEHALWRIENDPDFLASMTGDPPAASYTLSLSDGDADIVITSSSLAAEGDGVSAYLSVTPGQIIEETPTTVTFTLRVVNDDLEPHVVTRAEADPRQYSPVYQAGTTTGMTTENPVYTAGRWRWDIVPGITVPGFGAEISMQWQMTVDEDDGNYWTGGSVRVANVGSISAPMSAAIRVEDTTTDIDIASSVTPSQVSAGSTETFLHTITLTNNGVSPYTAEWIKHAGSRDLDYVDGSTSGITTADPQINHDVINNRWVHTWNVDPTVLMPGVPQDITFSTQGALLPGTIFSVAEMRTTVDESTPSSTPSATTGDTAPITAIRSFAINVIFDGHVIDVLATLGSAGTDVLSWERS